MIIDVNAYLGHWPFRQLRHNTVSGLLKLMDENSIDKAVVSSINSIFYKNCHAGNEELAAEIKVHRDRFIPFATLNPEYPGWRDDLKQCHDEFGMVGMRLFPLYHRYKLSGVSSLDMIHCTTEKNMALSIPIRVSDRRQRHWLDNVDELAISKIESVIDKCPNAKFIILNGSGLQNSDLVTNEKFRSANVLFEISRLSTVLREEIPNLISAIGPSKLVFGTGIPFKYPAPALLKMQILDVPQRVKEQIYWKNVAQMLSIQ